MRKLNFELTIHNLRRADDSVRAKAFDIINKGYRSNESDKVKSKEILAILDGGKLNDFTFYNILKLIEFGNSILFPVKVDRRSELIPEENWGVHKTHCCLEHGCKYMDRNCPVITGQIEQDYMCESCREDEYENKCQEERYK